MEKIILCAPDVIESNEDSRRVSENLKRLNEQIARVYRTYVGGFEFVTTSKDIHLLIGLLEERSQLSLAKIIHSKYDRIYGDGVMIFENPNPKKAVYATVRESAGTVFIDLQSAR